MGLKLAVLLLALGCAAQKPKPPHITWMDVVQFPREEPLPGPKPEPPIWKT